MRSDDIVPLAMEPIGVKIDLFHVGVGHFAAGGIFAAIQSTGHGQAFRGRRLGNEIDDRLVIPQGFATPIRGNERKEAVFDFVPLTGTGRKVTHRNPQACFIRELLQLDFPQPLSTCTESMIVSASTRAKRSTRRRASLCGTPLMRADAPFVAIQPLSLKFVVSTTSVLPSPAAAWVSRPQADALVTRCWPAR
jgi:hypothetical protein